ncbi:MAG: tRNA threonylcarbamoyladenosine dehydratase [Lentisphaeria bacterium]|nr:tRNA threonylcarbamoyladenosine dehydratase [Lentisphaeria bacterium]
MPTAGEPFERLRLLVGAEGLALLRRARVAVFGVGGVGSYAAEALARAAVGHLVLVDFDVVKASNINRQLPALVSTLGQPKVQVMAARIRDINPDCEVVPLPECIEPDGVADRLRGHWDGIVDAVDRADVKIALLAECVRRGIPVVSSMGAANKLLPGAIRTDDISRSRQCPLARAIRKGLRRLGIASGVTVVYSEELPIRLPGAGHAFQAPAPEEEGDKRAQGTVSYMPALFGLCCAAAILRQIVAGVEVRRRGETPPGPKG